MGVKDLWSILEPVKQHTPLKELAGQTIAVDLSIWICETQQLQGIFTKPYLRNIFFRVNNLVQLDIRPVFVIDGTPPEVKWETIQKRLAGGVDQSRTIASGRGGHRGASTKPKKMSRSHFKRLANECCELLSTLGMPCVQSSGEAEAMCALLNASGLVDGCVTNDGDAFLYGAKKVYRNFTLNNKDPHVESYSMKDVESVLGLNQNSLVSLALLLGCDYLPKGVPGVGKEMALKLLKEIQGCNVLERFRSWRSDKSLQLCVTGVSSKKPTHCGLCGHAGSQRDHQRQGCVDCQSNHYCEPDTGFQCTCTWHEQQKAANGRACEVAVWKKARTIEEFPNRKVIAEFCAVKDKVPRSAFVWGSPRPFMFHRFASQRMEWEGIYAMGKIIPLLSLVELKRRAVGDCRTCTLQPHSIVKERIRQGIPCVEVHWYKLDTDDIIEEPFYVTIEDKQLFTSCYPDLVQAFEEAQLAKKSKGKKKTKKDKSESSGLLPASENVNEGDVLPAMKNLDTPSMPTTAEMCDPDVLPVDQDQANVQIPSISSCNKKPVPLDIAHEPLSNGALDSQKAVLSCSGMENVNVDKELKLRQEVDSLVERTHSSVELNSQRKTQTKATNRLKNCKLIPERVAKLAMHDFEFTTSDSSSSDDSEVDIHENLLPLSQRLLSRASDVRKKRGKKGNHKENKCNQPVINPSQQITVDLRCPRSKHPSPDSEKHWPLQAELSDLCSLMEESHISVDSPNHKTVKSYLLDKAMYHELSDVICETDSSALVLDASASVGNQKVCSVEADRVHETVEEETFKEKDSFEYVKSKNPDMNRNTTFCNFHIETSVLSNWSQCSSLEDPENHQTKSTPESCHKTISHQRLLNDGDKENSIATESPVVLSLAERLKKRQDFSRDKRKILASFNDNTKAAETRFLSSLSQQMNNT